MPITHQPTALVTAGIPRLGFSAALVASRGSPVVTDLIASGAASLPDYAGPPLYDLSYYVGVIKAAQRRSGLPGTPFHFSDHVQGLASGENIPGILQEFEAQNIPLNPVDVTDDIFQTSNEYRSIVELVSNALDASTADVHVRCADGSYEVFDSGIGMDATVLVTRFLVPKLSGKPDIGKQIGRFGIGFYTALRHLKNDGDRVVVETKTQGEENGHRVTFCFFQGKLWLGLEKITAETAPEFFARIATGGSGSLLKIYSEDIITGRIEKEMDRYLRHANDQRDLFFNGKRINGHCRTPMGEWGNIKVSSCEYSWQGQAVVKVGDVIIEQYRTEGNGVSGELIFDLPLDTKLSITRDAVGLTPETYASFAGFVEHQTDIRILNSLTGLFDSFDKRHPDKSYMDLLKNRVKKLAKEWAAGGKRVYPDQAGLKQELMHSTDVIFLNPSIYPSEAMDQFKVPPQFQGGTCIHEDKGHQDLKLVLSPDLKAEFYWDNQLGVIYLRESVYESRAGFVLSAMQFIPGLEFRIRWGALVESGVARMVAKQQVEPAKDADILQRVRRHVAREGLDLGRFSTSFQNRQKYNFINPAILNGKVIIRVQNTQGLYGILDENLKEVLPCQYKWIATINLDGRELLSVQNTHGLWGILDDDLKTFVLPFHYSSIATIDLGDRQLLIVQNVQGLWGILDDDLKTFVLSFHYSSIATINLGDRQLLRVQNAQGLWGILDENLQEVLPCQYEDITTLDNSLYLINQHLDMEVLNLKAIEALFLEPEKLNRYQKIRSLRYLPGPYIPAIMHCPDSIWQKYIQDSDGHWVLRACSNLAVLAYVTAQADFWQASATEIELVKIFSRFYKSSTPGIYVKKMSQVFKSSMDLEKLLQDIRYDRKSLDRNALEDYLANDDQE